jgi:diguanylate cyclase (GGDEF)-like protein
MCALLLTMFTVYTSVRLTEQLAMERGVERVAWLAGSAAVAGIARFAVQLCFLHFMGMPTDPMFDVSWLTFGLLLTVLGRLIALNSVTRKKTRLRTLLPIGMFEGATIVFTQLALFRAAHFWYPFPAWILVAMLGVCGFVCVFALTTAAQVIVNPAGKWPGARAVYLVGIILGVFAIRFTAGALGVLSVFDRQQIPTHPQAFEVPETVVGMIIFFAGVALCIANVSLFLQRRAVRWSRDLKQVEERQEMTTALAEQRVVRLQNEALMEEIRERKRIEAKLAHSAFHDPITGLHNRAYLSEDLNGKLHKKQTRTPFMGAMLYIDLDNFKSVNDMLGHALGDRLLIEVSGRMQRCLCETDLLARMGGDEFAVMLGSTAESGRAMRLARHMLSVLEESILLAGTTFNLSASVGLCSIDCSYSTAEEVLRDADLAMYHAKRQGGARVVKYEPFMHAEAVAAMNARTELKSAIDNEEFVLWYQPLVDMHNGSIYGMEALIRWQHPQKGLVGPGTFIQLAEDTGHIVEIGNWVLRRACTDYARLQKHAAIPLLLSLNVSTRQLELSGFMDLLKKVLAETRMPAERLQLEITESILLGDPAGMGRLFQEIRALGVKIAFDDFGTGYSSLSYIQRYPVDTLKIDQSFVRGLKDDAVNADIICMLIGLSQTLNMSVSGEGVETPEEASALQKLGCRVVQGFLYSRPVPMHDFLLLFDRPYLGPATKVRTKSAVASFAQRNGMPESA